MDRGLSRYVLGAIFARGGSKGLPRKNVRPLGGRPLIGWSIATGLATPEIGRLIVSTDDAEIAETSRVHGAEVPFLRPAELATDTAPEILAWRHALDALRDREPDREIEAMVSLPATSPFRSVEDVRAAITMLRESDADVVISVMPANRNPYFNMVTFDAGGWVQIAAKPEKPIARRQDAPVVYDITTVVYAVRPEFVRTHDSLLSGRVRAVVVPPERAVDIDTLMDFEYAEFLLQRQAVRSQES